MTFLQRYINIHTHRLCDPPAEDTLELLNIRNHFDHSPYPPACSMGLHPWHLCDLENQMNMLEQYSQRSEVKAIGECGLDKLCATDLNLQQEAFSRQIAWAGKIGKPLIIHCVKAYTETLYQLRKATVPVIFHGFQKKAALALQIARAGHYISFGPALIRTPQVQEAFEQIDAGRFFLETDDTGLPVKEIYRAAAGIRKTEEDVIILQVRENYKKVFGL